MKKPELLVTPVHVRDMEALCEAGADAFVIGEEQYGLRLAGEFSREDVKTAIELAHAKDKKVYVAVNAIFHNDRIPALYDYMKFLNEVKPDAIIFGDPAVVMAARDEAPTLNLHWSTETTGTNWYHCNYWGKKGSSRAVLPREINMDAVIETKENAEVEIEVQVHGMSAMFQSKRSLLGNYFEYQGKALEIENRKNNKNMFLHDKERENKYPIFEDCNGTHIMSPNDMCLIDELDELIEAGIESFKIDGILKSPEYILEVTKLYRLAIDLCVTDHEQYQDKKDDWVQAIEAIQPPNRRLDTGFFFKETVY